ncbi:putative powdery mildew-specific protein [Golovinomyces cichoracearum]|uniref:Putative powdery mildew-specific protein n=1 Tax=Golovinomyces cichoracearum TaxID=62708 RepID=A0A420HMT7_9PEZI|nr:putative powdery mildew-specific protein [Golovinomyces cichoracearum]
MSVESANQMDQKHPTNIINDQQESWSLVFKDLCLQLEHAKSQKNQIDLLVLQNTIKDTVRRFCGNGIFISKSLIYCLVQQLENSDIRSRIHESLLVLIMEIVLQPELSRFSERAVYLLTVCSSKFNTMDQLLIFDWVSLHNDYILPEDIPRKEYIIKRSLPFLTKYLVDSKKNYAMRRWVGVLCLELHRELICSRESMDTYPNTERKQFGRLIIEEPDKILKIICGQILRCLCEHGTPVEKLFPHDYKDIVRNSFPHGIKEGKTWYESFQDYLRSISMQIDGYREQNGEVITLISSKFMKPDNSLFFENQIIYLGLERESITILVPPTTTNINQIIEIYYHCIDILKLTVREPITRSAFVIAEFQFKRNPQYNVVLNGEETKLSSNTFQLSQVHSEILKNHFVKFFPEIEIEMNSASNCVSDSNERHISNLSTHSSTCEFLVRRNISITKASNHSIAATRKTNILQTVPVKARKIMARQKEQEPKIQQKIMKTRAVKPKAKQPLVFSRRSIGDLQKTNGGFVEKLSGQASEKDDLNVPTKKIVFKDQPKTPIPSNALPSMPSIFNSELSASEEVSLPIRNESPESGDKYAAGDTRLVATAVENGESSTNMSKNIISGAVLEVRTKDDQKKHPFIDLKISQAGKKSNLKTNKERNNFGIPKISFIEKSTTQTKPSYQEKMTGSYPSKYFVDNNQKYSAAFSIPDCNAAIDVENLQQKDARSLEFIAEHSNDDICSPGFISSGSKPSPNATTRAISTVNESQSVNRSSANQNPSLFSKRKLAFVKGINSFEDKIYDNHMIHTKEKIPHVNDMVSSQTRQFKIANNMVCKPGNNISLLGLASKSVLCEDLVPTEITTKNSCNMDLIKASALESSIIQKPIDTKISPEAITKLEVKVRRAFHEPTCNNMISQSSELSKDLTVSEPITKAATTHELDITTSYFSKKRKSNGNDLDFNKKHKNEAQKMVAPDEDTLIQPDPGSLYEIKSGLEKKQRSNEIKSSNPIVGQSADQTESKKPEEILVSNKISYLAECDKNTTALDNRELRRNIIDENLARKPQLISFGYQGARNQGQIGVSSKETEHQRIERRYPYTHFDKILPRKPSNKFDMSNYNINSTKVSAKNRAVDLSCTTCDSKLPISSQEASFTMKAPGLDSEINSAMISNPRRDLFGPSFEIPNQLGSTRIGPRTNSQGPKVTYNGSPIGVKDSQRYQIESLYIKSKSPKFEQRDISKKKISDTSGLKLNLPKRLEVGPLSPKTGAASGFLSHETNDDINFTDMKNNEVISQKTEQDPFFSRDPRLRRQNLFLDLMRGSAARLPESITNKNSDPSFCKSTLFFDPHIPTENEESRTHYLSRANIQQRSDKWNSAIRARYKGVSDTVHRIADDLIMRLAKEENRLRLLVDQYKKNGTNIVNQISKCHEEEQALLLRCLVSGKTELLAMESKVRNSISDIHDSLRKNPVSRNLTQWKRTHDDLRLLIAQNRMRTK